MVNIQISKRAMRLITATLLTAMLLSFGTGLNAAEAQTIASYDGVQFGFSIEWDEEIWTGEEIDFSSGVEGLDFESVASYGTVQAMAADGTDAETCLGEMRASFAEDDGDTIQDFGTADSRLDLPEGLDEAASGLYYFSVIDKDNEFGQILYLSCSVIDDGETLLQIFLGTNDNAYEDVIPEWDELIGGISLHEVDSEQKSDDTEDAPFEDAEITFEDGHYLNPFFGVELSWDDSLWSAEELTGQDGEGVTVWTEYSYGTFRISESEAIDSDACLEFMAGTFGTGDHIHDFDEASRKVELPESELVGESNLYSLTMDSDGEPIEMYMYLECVPVLNGGGALMIMLVSSTDAYEQSLPEFNDLLAGVDTFDVEKSSINPSDDVDTEDVDPNDDLESFESHDLGFSVQWDPEIWNGAPFDDHDGIGVEFESELAYGVLVAEESDLTADECVEELAYQLEANPEYKKVRKAPSSMERPDVPEGVSAELFTMVDKNSPTKYAILFACGPTSIEEVMLNGRFLTISSDWEAALADVQELIDGIVVIPVDQLESDDPVSDDADVELESVSSPQFGVEISFDPSIWEIEDHSDEEMDNIGLVSDHGRFSVVAYESDDDLVGCVDALVENEANFALDEVAIADVEFERPELNRGAEGELYEYTFDGEEGPLDVVVYLECRQIVEGESVVGIAIFTTVDLYEDALPEFQLMLDSMKTA